MNKSSKDSINCFKKSFVVFVLFCVFLTGCSMVPAISTEIVKTQLKTIVDFEKGGSPSTPPKDMELVTHNDSLALFANLSTGEFAVENLIDHGFWYSNPQNRLEDDYAIGVVKNELDSLITVTDVLIESGVTKKRNSTTAALNKKALKVSKIDNGFIVSMKFKDQKYTIPMKIELLEDSLYVSIDMEKIIEEGKEKIYSINILPYLGAQYKTADGYFLLPDGSGSIMQFNNGKYIYGSYRAPVYGRDALLNNDYLQSDSEKISLPIYGISTDKGAMVAIMNAYEANAYVNASVSEYNSLFNSANFEVTTRINHTGSIGSGYNAQEVRLYEDRELAKEKIGVRYFFLKSTDNQVADMASVTREYLKNQLGVKQNIPDKTGIVIKTLGAVEVRKSVLGLQMDILQPATTLKAADTIIHSLKKAGIEDISLIYTEWSNDQARGEITRKYDPIGKLGSKGQLETLADTLGGKLYLTESSMYFSKYTGISHLTDSIKDLTKFSVVYYPYKRNTFFQDKNVDKQYLLQTRYMLSALESLAGALQSATENLGLALEDVAAISYSDFSDNGNTRTSQTQLINQTLNSLSGISIASNNPNMYALSNSTLIYNLPTTSSKYDVTDSSIPFYQMVLHGLVAYSNSSINQSASPERDYLLAVSTGSQLQYDLIGVSPSELKETSKNSMYSADFSKWKPIIERQYMDYKTIYEQISDAYIVDYREVENSVIYTEYSNGIYTLVNMSDKDVAVNQQTVPASSFLCGEVLS